MVPSWIHFCCATMGTLPILFLHNNFKLLFQGMLADYVSQTSPMIPSIVVHCVNEIEQRGLNEVRLHPWRG